jgi:hypothetical protein
MFAGVFEHRKAEREPSFPNMVGCRQSILLMFNEQRSQMLESAPLQVILAGIVGIER